MGAGVVLALLVVSITGLYLLGKYSESHPRMACYGSEDFVALRSKMKEMLESGNIDGAVVERESPTIQKALDLCALGKKNESRALLMGVLMDAAFQSDEVYARKVNGTSRADGKSRTAKKGTPHGDPDHPRETRHPLKRYELIAKAKAPGSWESVTGQLTFVVNSECVPEGFHSRGWLVPNVAYSFAMKRTDDDTWKGYFYRDALQDENYFGLGTCHWDAAHVAANFTVHGTAFHQLAMLYFGEAATFEEKESYFLKSEFLKAQPDRSEVMGFSHYDPDTSAYPERYFTISARVQKAAQ
jgi:hypothetical protein